MCIMKQEKRGFTFFKQGFCMVQGDFIHSKPSPKGKGERKGTGEI